MQKKQTRIVLIGGGTGLSTLLRGLKKFPVDLTAIVTVADDGGSSGRLRDDFAIPPPGDVRNVIAALSEVEPLVEEMFQYRFKGKEELGGHSLGNLMLTALTEITGDFSHAIREMSRVLNVHGKVLPAANQRITLMAELIDGTIVKGESKIPTFNTRIKRVYLSPPDVLPLQEAVNAIENADIIIIGPGSLYTSILPNLLVEGIKKAVLKSKGHKIYICNLMTQSGETSNYTAGDHVQALYDHVGKNFIQTILINDEEVPKAIREAYIKESAEPVQFDVERLESMGLEVVKKDIANIHDGVVRHETNRVAAWLVEYATNYQQNKQKLSN
ncbi:uridine diphosphate-N-acetylglucosamine-binding protein YvcK [Rummeliibacillus pycnus]|uniref:uridine diphosphate-N-acetylglucosamine-binding protein YvcK n=1 Tax=Rummeliibacillus pycnus TaxID=101070 RepID=UPI0037CC40BE